MKADFFAPIAAAVIFFSSAPMSTLAADVAEDTETPVVTHTVTLLDFDGKVLEKIKVVHGESVDLSSFDVSSLNRYPDIYTQQGFSEWSPYPDSITENIKIQALYKKMMISSNGAPTKKEYFTNVGSIDLTGLDIIISVETQVPVIQKDGSYKIELEKETVNITDKCTTSPADLSEAFKKGAGSAEIAVFPILEEKAIFNFKISYFDRLGDVNNDGTSDASDASAILDIYSQLSTGKKPTITDDDMLCCDVDRNGAIDSSDASVILNFYSLQSTSSGKVTWDDFFN